MAAVSASTTPEYRAAFGPFLPGFVAVPFGDAAALERAIDAEHLRRARSSRFRAKAASTFRPTVIWKRCARSATSAACCSGRRSTDRLRPHRRHVRVRSRGRKARRARSSERRSAAATTPSPRRSPTTRSWASSARAITAALSAATRSLAPSRTRPSTSSSPRTSPRRARRAGAAIVARAARDRAPPRSPRSAGAAC